MFLNYINIKSPSIEENCNLFYNLVEMEGGKDSDQERYVRQLIDKGTIIQNTLSTVIRLFNEQICTSFVLVYITISVMGAFSLTTLLLNRRSRNLVELIKIQKKELDNKKIKSIWNNVKN
ncbi:MAG: hypothetical protein WKF36_11010 [Candidatus Nitrosocosmicus sp.]